MTIAISELMPSLEAAMLKLDQVPCDVVHRFGPGVYIREVAIPAGTFAIGHHQNFDHTNVMIKGRVSVLNDNGSTSELCAPLLFVGKPGRKIGYIHEDVVWLNIYATEETDIEKLEAQFLTKSEEYLNDSIHKSALAKLKSTADIDDFKKLIEEFGTTEELVRNQSEFEGDITDLPHGSYKIKMGDSPIEGKGIFATSSICVGEVIAPARINGMRTIAGRFTNHSINPNARMVRWEDSDINLVAIRPIQGCKGGEDGEEITINYRESVHLTLEIGGKVKICQA